MNGIGQSARGVTLDDVPVNGVTRDQFTDDLQNEPASQLFIIKPLQPLAAQIASPQRLSSGFVSSGSTGFDLDAFNMVSSWQGPFVEFNRFFKGIETIGAGVRLKTSTLDSTTDEVSRDFPLDPWGQPYRVFSPYGIMGTNAIIVDGPDNWETDNKFDFQPNLGSRGTFTDPYDRWAIVSLGPNGQFDTIGVTSGTENDDIVYFFGTVIAESAVNPL
ncbi:MAG: hypothetical protein NTW86_23370 [Candidatus Sumerlaeota bacterium]|nr:hypothetical protein [Candidatus Sumerlaeota bacterium]